MPNAQKKIDGSGIQSAEPKEKRLHLVKNQSSTAAKKLDVPEHPPEISIPWTIKVIEGPQRIGKPRPEPLSLWFMVVMTIILAVGLSLPFWISKFGH